jgi:adenine/guanine phosphoribosyltransferase-like PRPP-binding protein
MNMNPEDFWQIAHPPNTFEPQQNYSDFYPAQLDDGRQILLPIRHLPDGKHALASLIINQASFEVLDAIASDLANKLKPLNPEIIVGLPTLGLTLASAVAQKLGHSRYIPLGTSAKFWYQNELSVPLSSITTPDQQKRLYIDPRMLPLLTQHRIALIDDVISTGTSITAALKLLTNCAAQPIAIAAAMLQSDRWRQNLFFSGPIISAFKTPILSKTPDDRWT